MAANGRNCRNHGPLLVYEFLFNRANLDEVNFWTPFAHWGVRAPQPPSTQVFVFRRVEYVARERHHGVLIEDDPDFHPALNRRGESLKHDQ
jgi:hypothetical protein